MSDAVDRHGLESGIAKDNLRKTFGGRVADKSGFDIQLQLAAHSGQVP